MRGSVVRAGGYALGLLLGLISAPLLTRHLGVVDYGRYITVFSVVALLAGVTEGGLNAMGIREHARLKGPGRTAVMRDMLGMRLTLTTLGGLAAVAFSVVAGYDSTMVLGTVGGAIALLFLTSQDFLMVGLQGELRFGSVTAAELVRQTASTVLIVALVRCGCGLAAAALGAAAGGDRRAPVRGGPRTHADAAATVIRPGAVASAATRHVAVRAGRGDRDRLLPRGRTDHVSRDV